MERDNIANEVIQSEYQYMMSENEWLILYILKLFFFEQQLWQHEYSIVDWTLFVFQTSNESFWIGERS